MSQIPEKWKPVIAAIVALLFAVFAALGVSSFMAEPAPAPEPPALPAPAPPIDTVVVAPAVEPAVPEKPAAE